MLPAFSKNLVGLIFGWFLIAKQNAKSVYDNFETELRKENFFFLFFFDGSALLLF